MAEVVTNDNLPREFKKYQAYICHANADTTWTMNMINMLEKERYQFKCAEYDRDFLGGKYIIDLFQEFMESSHFIIIVLSPSFLESKWSMFQLYLTVQYSLDNNEGNIVPLVYRACDIPLCMKVFEPVDATKRGWEKTLANRLLHIAKRFPKGKGICTRDGRISIDALRTYNTRDVMSEPLLEETCNKLSEHNYYKVKILNHKRRSKPEFLDEKSNISKKTPNNENSLSLSDVARSSGEMAQAKRESGTNDRIPADDIFLIQEHIPSTLLSPENIVRAPRTRNSNGRVDADIVLNVHANIDENSLTVGAKSKSVRVKTYNHRGRMDGGNLLEIHENIQETALEKGEKIQQKRVRANRKRRNAENLHPKQICEAVLDGQDDSVKPCTFSLSETHKFVENDHDRDNSSKCVRMSDEVTAGNSGTQTTSDNVMEKRKSLTSEDGLADDGYQSCEYSLANTIMTSLESDRDFRRRQTDVDAIDDSTLPHPLDQKNDDSLVDEEADLKKLQNSLPPEVLFIGDCAKNVRERNGKRKKRIDADVLILNEYEGIRL